MRNCKQCEFNNNGWCLKYRRQKPVANRICSSDDIRDIEMAIEQCHDEQINIWLQELIEYKTANDF